MNDLRSDLDTALREGKTPKQFAASAGISVSWAYRLAWELGFRSVYISEGERRLLDQVRKQTLSP